MLGTACSDEDESCEQYAKCTVRDPLWRLKDRIVQSLASFTVNELVSDDAPEPLTLVRRPSEAAFSAPAAADR